MDACVSAGEARHFERTVAHDDTNNGHGSQRKGFFTDTSLCVSRGHKVEQTKEGHV